MTSDELLNLSGLVASWERIITHNPSITNLVQQVIVTSAITRTFDVLSNNSQTRNKGAAHEVGVRKS